VSINPGHDDFIYCITPVETNPPSLYLCACEHLNIFPSLVCLSCARIENVDAVLRSVERATIEDGDRNFLREMGVGYDG
jgi:hypothetical protein